MRKGENVLLILDHKRPVTDGRKSARPTLKPKTGLPIKTPFQTVNRYACVRAGQEEVQVTVILPEWRNRSRLMMCPHNV